MPPERELTPTQHAKSQKRRMAVKFFASSFAGHRAISRLIGYLSLLLLSSAACAERLAAEEAGFLITPDMRAAMKMSGRESPKAWLGNAIQYNYQTDPMNIEVGQKYRLPEARKKCTSGDADACKTARDIEKWLSWAKAGSRPSNVECDRNPCDQIPVDLIPPALKGKTWLLHAWASWCPYCRMDHVRLSGFPAAKKARFVSFVFKDTDDAAAKFLLAQGNPYAGGNVRVPSQTLDRLELRGVPASYVIGPEGKVMQRFSGTLGSEGQDALEKYLAD